MRRLRVNAGAMAAGLSIFLMAQPAHALLAADTAQSGNCPVSKQKGRLAKIFGGVGEGLTNIGLGKIGIRSDAQVRNTMRDFLSDGIACALSPAEQAEAAKSTEAAVNKGVGAKGTWTSDTRKGVSGTSEVTGQTKSADGTVCRAVTQVVTVDGEEKTEVEHLCKARGETGFTRNA